MNKRVPFYQRAIAQLKAFLTLCFAVLFCLSSFTAPAWANQEITAYGINPVPAPGSAFADVIPNTPCNATDVTGCNVPGTTYDMTFGTGTNDTLQSLVIGGRTFVPNSSLVPPVGLADRIVFRRNPAVPVPSRSVLFHAVPDPPGLPLTSPIDVLPEVANTLEEGLLSLITNRGIDNLFNNISDPGPAGEEEETRNNIERVDYIISNGLNVPVASRPDFGFIVLDRGGNDPFQVAAITGLDAGGNPSSYGPLTPQPLFGAAAYGGGVANNIISLVSRDDDLTVADPVIQPSHAVPAQDVRGRFFSIADLLPPGDTTTTNIFGYSIFASDVTDGGNPANLIDFTNQAFFPIDTTGTGAGAPGGLDLIAGGAVLSVETEPQIGVAKTTSAPRPVAGQAGFFDVDFTLRVTNTGTTVLNNVQLTEDLTAALIDAAANRADAFALANAPVIDASGVTGTAPTLNPAYTGTNVTPGTTDVLFAPGNSFNVGDTAVVTVTARVDVGTNIGGPPPLDDGVLLASNQATATGTSPGGQTVTDLSQDGTDVDPDNDGNPGNNNDPTPIQIPFPSVGVAKSVSAFRQVPGTTQYDFDFTIIVTNSGATNLENVTLVENLQEALITNATNRVDSFTVLGPPTVTTTGFTGTPPTANPAFDGVGDVQVLTGASTFNPGDTLTAVINVRAELGSGGTAPLNDGVVIAQNTATATGTPSGPGVPPGTGPVTDTSQNGTNIDPDNDGNPGNNNDPTPIQFPSTATDLVLVKRITNIFRGGTALPVPGITNFNDQPGDLNDNDAALNAALGGGNQLAGIFQLPAGLALEPNDEVEYTIYLWNSSAGQITQLNICDELQPPSVLNTNVGFELDQIGPLGSPTFGPAGGAVQGRSPGAPLEGFCPSAPGSFPLGPPGPTGGLGVGAGGGVVAGPFTVPSNQFGAFRFRVRVP